MDLWGITAPEDKAALRDQLGFEHGLKQEN